MMRVLFEGRSLSISLALLALVAIVFGWLPALDFRASDLFEDVTRWDSRYVAWPQRVLEMAGISVLQWWPASSWNWRAGWLTRRRNRSAMLARSSPC